jgi:FMN phosphatase YigB (HAD superfamily)
MHGSRARPWPPDPDALRSLNRARGDNRRMPTISSVPLPTRAILFDLGGVLLHVDFHRALEAWAPYSRLPPERLRESFSHDEPYQLHEIGALPADGYFMHLRQELALECDTDTVQAGFNAVFLGEIEETVRLLDAARARVPCYAISNTNAVHVAEIERAFPQLLPRFTRVFASHEIGHRKPHRKAFEHVLEAIGVPPAEVLLFDDLIANVEGARALGLQAVLVRSPEDVREALQERGLL